jgi:hypothetical protein
VGRCMVGVRVRVRVIRGRVRVRDIRGRVRVG